MPDLLGILETSLYVDAFERACPFYEQVLGLNSIYRDARLCAYDVGGRGVLLLFLRGGSRAPSHLPGGTVPPHDGHGPNSHGFFHRRRRACGLGSALCRGRRRDREPGQMAARRRKHLFPRPRRPRTRIGDAGIVAWVLEGSKSAGMNGSKFTTAHKPRASVTRRPPGDLFPSPGQFGRGSPVFLKNNPRQSKWNKVSGIRRGEEAVAPPHGRRSPFERFDPCLAKAKKPSGATTPQAESAAHLIFWISSRDSLIRSRTRRYSARASRV